MAYNPFDDIIDSDPAYMQTGGRTVIPQRRADYTQETFKPIATAISKGYQLLTPEQETKDEIEKNKQLRQLATAQALKGTQFEEYAGQADLPSAVIQSPGIMERLQQAGYKPQGFIEGMSRIGEFFYGDQRQAFDKLSQGQQLTDQDRTAIALSPLDSLDFLFPPLAIKKLGSMGLKTVDDVLKSTADIEEVKQIKNYFGGQGFTPAGVVRAPETGGSGASAKKTRAEINKIRGDKQKEQVDNIVLDYIQKNPGGTPQDMMKATGLSESQKQKSILRLKKSNPEILEKNLVMGKQGIYKKDIIKVLEDIGFDKSISYKELSDLVPTANQSQIATFFNQPLSQIPGDEAAKYTYKDLYPNVYGFGTKDFGDGKGVVRIKDGIINALKKVPEGEMIQIDDFSKKLGVSYNAVREAAGTDSKLLDKIEFRRILDPDNMDETDNIEKARAAYTKVLEEKLGQGPGGRETLLFFDGFLRSSSPESFGFTRKDFVKKSADGRNIFDKDAWYEWRMNRFVDDFGPNWRSKFDEEFQYINDIEGARDKANDEIKQFLADKKKKHPNILKDLNYMDYQLQIAHNFPLAKTSKRDEFVDAGMMKGSSRLGFAATNLKHHQRLESILYSTLGQIDFLKQNNKIPEGQIPQSANKLLAYVDEEAKKLGTVIYFKIDDKVYKAGREESPSPEALVQSFKNHINVIIGQNKGKGSYNPKKFKDKKFGERKVIVTGKSTGKVDVPEKQENVLYKKGGAVKMARGGIGNILQNMNQQEFTPDPAIEGDSAFQQAVKSENLYAFNPSKILKFFGNKVPGVFTPSKRNKNMELMSDAPSAPGTTLPVEQPIQDYDFAFKSFTLDKVNSKNAPKAAKPQDWINFLQGGDIAPKAEILDSGLFQYMEDFERYYPNQKLTREQITEFYEQSPISNLQVKVKAGRDDASPYDVMSQETMGRARHKNAGSARIDEGGENYREIVIEAGALPGEEKPFISSGHFEEPNVLVFSRVADYKNADGQNVSVIQEMQTDLLTKVRKEQERLAAAIGEAKVKLAANQRVIEQGDAFDNYRMDSANQNIQQLSQQIPKLEQLAETKLIKPYPLTVAKELIPTYEKQLLDLQQEINALAQAGVDRTDPEFLMKISQIEQQQQGTLNELLNLNRSKNFETLTQDVKVPTASNSEELQQIAQNQSSYHTTRPIETFPPIPFNNQADYVDLILKATIKDAENRGINKIAIMPADVGANPRWSKNNEDARKKFQNLYDKVGVQQLKNIAKKYGGNVEIEKISDPTRSTMGLRISKPSLNRDSFDFLKDVDVDRSAALNDPEGSRNFLDEEIVRIASDLGDKSVIYRKETAPGQTMDYYVKVLTYPDEKGSSFRLDPLKEGDVDTDAQILIEDYNPSLVDMFVLTMEEGKQKAPMYMFKKKEGGIIPEDRLVSITDIYGDY